MKDVLLRDPKKFLEFVVGHAYEPAKLNAVLWGAEERKYAADVLLKLVRKAEIDGKLEHAERLYSSIDRVDVLSPEDRLRWTALLADLQPKQNELATMMLFVDYLAHAFPLQEPPPDRRKVFMRLEEILRTQPDWLGIARNQIAARGLDPDHILPVTA